MVEIITEEMLAQTIGYDADALAQVEQAYVWMQERRLSMPPVFHIEIDDDSAVDVKGAYVEGVDAFAIKMASGFYRNAARGLVSSSSVILLIDADTGFCKAVFLDNGYLMNLRTALAGAVAAKHLAPEYTRTVGVVGTGVQARAQVQALALVREFEKVIVWGRDPAKANDCAADIAATVSCDVTVSGDLADVVSQSDVLITTTQTTTPLIKPEWVRAGQHITAMGSDLPGKQELDAVVLANADLVVCDSIDQCLVGGELQHVAAADLRSPAVALGSVITGQAQGRQRQSDITLCDMTGLGVLDTAIAVAAFARVTAG